MSATIEHLFYWSYYGYLKGNLQESTLYYKLLKEEFKEFGKKDSLSHDQLCLLKKIKNSIESGDVAKNQWLTEVPKSDTHEPQNDQVNQVELVRIIDLKGSIKLRDILGGGSDTTLYNIEHPCPPYGAVDMVYKDSTTIYPLEVKKDQGRHDIIGQIMKYDLHFKLLLHYKMYKKVQPVTICGYYDQYTLGELKKLGVVTVGYKLKKGDLTLFRV